ncbi:MAG: 4Fe-4S binding protein [Elusimicrobiales bacterium]|nr:4Fe-4S binding protein [Elusimicrobiales bacterium]
MNKKIKVLAGAAALVALVIAGSLLSVRLWGGKGSTAVLAGPLAYSSGMTPEQFAAANDLPREVASAAFGSRFGPPGHYGELPPDGLKASVERELALYNEAASKNWRKILLKFVMWSAFLAAVFPLLRRGFLQGAPRNWVYLAAVLLFGVALGADPSPMGTVKDAVVLYGRSGAIFPPRLIALFFFLLLVVAANKFICSWGCQLGVLQDLLFRLGRAGELKRWRPPFSFTNTVRVLFFIALVLAALLLDTDIIEPVDPFKIYSPLAPSVWGWAGITLLLGASLFVYRPWCHLFCPFGLAGWLAEKISVYRIKVDYAKCVACGACAKACPSTVMGAILKRDRAIPDCFSCGDCLAACPARAVSFSAGRRETPPADKFKSQGA